MFSENKVIKCSNKNCRYRDMNGDCTNQETRELHKDSVYTFLTWCGNEDYMYDDFEDFGDYYDYFYDDYYDEQV